MIDHVHYLGVLEFVAGAVAIVATAFVPRLALRQTGIYLLLSGAALFEFVRALN
jgi:hypothetical protein